MYDHWQQKKITDFSEQTVEEMYNNGFVFTRPAKGVMHQIKSVRIDLSSFKLSSENRRVLKKTEDLAFVYHKLPYKDYTWEIGKLAKDFYDQKGGQGTMSANKIKELFTNPDKSNMNAFFNYLIEDKPVGYCLLYEFNNILHYAYPFYNLKPRTYNLPIGMSMMIKAVLWAQESGKQLVYLGSYQKYKLQFKGLEYFEKDQWYQI